MKNTKSTHTQIITDVGTVIEINNDSATIECNNNYENVLKKRKIYKNHDNQYIIIRREKIFL